MTVKLSQLRVSADMDATGYARGMSEKIVADKAGIASGQQVAANLAKQDIAAGNAGGTLGRLARTYVDGYGSASKFYSSVNSLQKQMELGNVSAERAALIYQGMAQKFGMVASAAEIAKKGNADFAAVVGRVNTTVNTNVTSLGKASVANDNLRQSAMAAQGVLSQLGVNIPIMGMAGPIAVIGAALAVVATSAVKSVNAFEKFESQALVLDAVLKSTGSSAGRTAKQIQDLVNEIGDISKTRDAAAVLLTFKTVATDTFDRTLKLADDLAAVMGTDVKSAALQLGKALEDPEKGLSALTRSGVSFSSQQKQIIKDLFETGQVAQAQGLILDQVAKQVGGAGAAKDAGLAGAYEALSDATQRLLERWGEQIAKAWGLSAAINGIAAAIERTNKLASNPALRLQVVDAAISDAQTRVNELSQQGLKGPAASAQTTLNRLLEQRVKLIEEVRRAQQAADAAGEAADRNSAVAEYDRRREAYDSVVRSIQKETEELRKNDLQKAISTNLSKAQVDATSAQGQEIIRLTTIKQREADAIKASAEAAKEAEALSKKQTEGLRRFNEELDSRMTKLVAERAGVGLSTEAALALKTAEEDMARLRERGIPISAAMEQDIRNRAAEYAKERIAVTELSKALAQAQAYAGSFGSAINSALAQGKSPKEAIGAGINAVGTKLSGDLMTAGIASGNPALIGASIGISILQGQAAKAKQAKADFDAAVKAWENMQTQVRHFADTLEGRNTGSLGQAISSMTEKTQEYVTAANKAGQSGDALINSLVIFARKATTDFVAGFGVMIEALDQGLGSDSPAVKAAANVKQIGDTLKGFLDDTVKASQGLAQANPAIVASREAVQNYALSLLQVKPALTETQSAILELRGTAAQLQQTLQDLGMSSDAAAQAIASGITSALDDMAAKLTDNLNRQINEASGKGYINQLDDLVKATLGNLTDADMTGVDTSLVAQLFMKQAQGIIDGAGLVGTEFDDLIKTFPQLANVLSQSQSALDDFSKNVNDFLNGLKLGSLSTLNPTQRLAAAQGIYDTTLGAAASGDAGAMGGITGAAESLLNVAKDYFASSPDYQRIFEKIQSDLTALPKGIGRSNTLLGSVDTNTDDTVSTLTALQSLQAATTQSSIDISSSVTQLGQQGAFVAATQGSQYFGPMVSLLTAISANTLAVANNPQSDPGSGFKWYNPFTWFHDGGIVGAYAPGGIVGNGTWNQDSVRASYAGGGDIMLAGGEGVINAAATRMIGPSVIDLMNRTGRLPSNDNMSGRDYTPHFMNIARVTAQGFNGQTEVLVAELRALRAEVRKLSEDKGIAPPKRPGTRAA